MSHVNSCCRNLMTDGLVDTGRNAPRDHLEIAAAFVIVIGVLLLVRQLDVLPGQFGISETMSYYLVFVVGLVASVSSCIAVTGSLIVAIAARYKGVSGELTQTRRLKPLLFFNVGRIVSYTVLGGVIGALGSALILSPMISGILTVGAAVVMILLGVRMLRLLPAITRFIPRMPNSFANFIRHLAEGDARGGAFALGAATVFLPCGFTQALQLYVLSKGSVATGALTMLAFSLGTLPTLLSLSFVSSLAAGGLQRYFLKFAGAAIIVLGFANVQHGVALSDSSMNFGLWPMAQNIAPADAVHSPIDTIPGKQIVEMRITGHDYLPNRFTVKQGVPVEWRIDVSDAALCARVLVSPGLGIRKLLFHNTTVISFIPHNTGEFSFNCGMGMMTPGSKFTVVPNA
jgi:sulfite exporter TauE/SafE